MLFLEHRRFSWRTHVWHELSRIGPFETECTFLYLDNYDMLEFFPSKTNSVLTGKQCPDATASAQMGFFRKISMHFINSAE
jgi:hypothetical protein